MREIHTSFINLFANAFGACQTNNWTKISFWQGWITEPVSLKKKLNIALRHLTV